MKLSLPPGLVKQNLDAHSVIGLTIGVIMYLVCLTGTLAVLAFEFERWEQPKAAEFMDYDAVVIENALAGFHASVAEPAESVYVVLPNADLPRIHVADENYEWFVETDGTLGPEVSHPWTHMLRDLHIHLHLPETLGIILVSIAGVTLLALIISGLLAHPRIFKDAFRLRLGGSWRLEQADIHNRLSVWGLPFHLMIAVTGAFYGLVGLLAFAAAAAFYEGDTEALIADVYGPDPVIEAPVQPMNIGGAFDHLSEYAPDASPIYLVVHHQGEANQFMEIAATLPGRLIYSEIYRYASDGSFLGAQGMSEGVAGRQFLYSLYRIHFGQFGGDFVKLAYVLLGMALTVVSVSGVNIWLARRGGRTVVNPLWVATVWGLPLALSLSAAASILFSWPPLWVVVAVLALAMFMCLRIADERYSRQLLQRGLGISLLVCALIHLIQYSQYVQAPASLTVNLSLLALALVFLWLGWRQPRLEPAASAM